MDIFTKPPATQTAEGQEWNESRVCCSIEYVTRHEQQVDLQNRSAAEPDGDEDGYKENQKLDGSKNHCVLLTTVLVEFKYGLCRS